MSNTVPTCAIARDVINLLLGEEVIDKNSRIPEGLLDSMLVAAESEFYERTGQSFRPITITEEVWDLEAHIARYPDLFDQLFGRWGIKLQHANIMPLSSARGHKLEVYRGSEPWEDYVTAKIEGRNQDYWVDREKSIIWIRKPFAMYRNSSVRVTYEVCNFLPTTLTGAHAIDVTTFTVASTKGYQYSGIFRAGREYIAYTSKSATQFLGCTRGALNTDPETHDSGDDVVQVPHNIRELMAKRAAVKLLQSEKFMAMLPEGAGGEYDIKSQITDWLHDWEEAISGTYQKWAVF